MIDRLLTWIIAILFSLGLVVYESLPWSQNEMPQAYVDNRGAFELVEAFELVAEYMADYDLSPYLPEEPEWSDGCVLYDEDGGEITLRSLPDYDGPVAQPDEATCEAVRQLFKRAKIISITKLATESDCVYFEKHLERPLTDRERDMVYNSKGLAYTADVDKEPTCMGFGMRVGILGPINEHWYYWYADEFD